VSPRDDWAGAAALLGSLMLHYEINSQNPARSGTQRLAEMGRLMVIAQRSSSTAIRASSLLSDVDRQRASAPGALAEHGGDPSLRLAQKSALEAEILLRAAAGRPRRTVECSKHKRRSMAATKLFGSRRCRHRLCAALPSDYLAR